MILNTLNNAVEHCVMIACMALFADLGESNNLTCSIIVGN